MHHLRTAKTVDKRKETNKVALKWTSGQTLEDRRKIV